MPPLPHHRAYGSVPRRFGGLSFHQLPRRKEVVAGLSRSDDAATAYTSLSQSGSAVHATWSGKRRIMSASRCSRRCETSVLLVLSFIPLRGPFGPSAAEAAYYALC